MNEKIIHNFIKPEDVIDIEYTYINRREHISAIVCYSSIHNGKGIAVLHDCEKNVYLWKPSDENPHGTVEKVNNSIHNNFLINPYITIYNKDINNFIPVDSQTGTYFTTKKMKHN